MKPEKPDINQGVPNLGPQLTEFAGPRRLEMIARHSRAVGAGVAALIFAGIGVLEVGARTDNEILKDIGVIVYDIDVMEGCADPSEETLKEMSELVNEHALTRELGVFDRWLFDKALVTASENGVTLEDPSTELTSLVESDNSLEMIGIAESYFAKLGIEYGYTTKDSSGKEHDIDYDADDMRKHLVEIIESVSLLPVEFIKYSGVSKITSQPHDMRSKAGTYNYITGNISLSTELFHYGLLRPVAFHEFTHAFDHQYCGIENWNQDIDWRILMDRGYVSDYSRMKGAESEDKAEAIGDSDIIMNLEGQNRDELSEEKLKLMIARIESVVPGVGKYLVTMSD